MQAQVDSDVVDTSDDSEFEETPATWGVKCQDASHDSGPPQPEEAHPSPISTGVDDMEDEAADAEKEDEAEAAATETHAETEPGSDPLARPDAEMEDEATDAAIEPTGLIHDEAEGVVATEPDCETTEPQQSPFVLHLPAQDCRGPTVIVDSAEMADLLATFCTDPPRPPPARPKVIKGKHPSTKIPESDTSDSSATEDSTANLPSQNLDFSQTWISQNYRGPP